MKNHPVSPNGGHEAHSVPQIDKFRDLARELECDDDEVAFDEKLKRLAKTPEPPKPDDK